MPGPSPNASVIAIDASVPAEQLSLIRVGVPVVFTVSGYPGREFVGHIVRVNPTADPTVFTQKGENIDLIMKGGEFFKNRLTDR